MTEDFEMRMRLQQVAAYRNLQRSVQRSGRENVVYALVMLGLAYFLHAQGLAGRTFLILYSILITSELLVGLFKWMIPVPEGLLLDACVLGFFATFIGWVEFRAFQNGARLDPIFIFIGLYMLYHAINRVRSYSILRRLFAQRPHPEHIAWFDDLVREIRSAEPQFDEQALDLPTNPHWKAKLLGTTAFFVSMKGNDVLIAGPEDFEILREKADHGTGRRKGLLRIHEMPWPEFEITDVTWTNYQKWRSANPLPQFPPVATSGHPDSHS